MMREEDKIDISVEWKHIKAPSWEAWSNYDIYFKDIAAAKKFIQTEKVMGGKYSKFRIVKVTTKKEVFQEDL